MNIEELMNSRKRLEQFYKKELEKSKSSDNKDVYEGELRDIEKEIAKIDALIEIYNNCISKHPQYMLIQLEKDITQQWVVIFWILLKLVIKWRSLPDG